MTTTVDTVVIGAGHAGLAVSRLLSAAGRDHVVLDRGRVGERWRSERWDSLHLLTPSWMMRLPGWSYQGTDPDGYLSAGAFVDHLEAYAASFGAPLQGGTTVEQVRFSGRGGVRYAVATDRGTWHADNVVVATGPHGTSRVPAGLPRDAVFTSSSYRNPEQLPDGGVLVVGASASGVQIADELNRAGRDVVLAVGRHTRMPRSYRGMDIFTWLELTGRLARPVDDMPDASVARREPSMQLIGRPAEHATRQVDLAGLPGRGVGLAGRFDGLARGRARFRPDLADNVAAADQRMHRTLDAVDEYVARAGVAADVLPASRPSPVNVPGPILDLELSRAGIGTVLVAAGYRPDYPWLRLPITDSTGAIRQYQGRTPAPGVYVVGQRFQHRRDSGFIDGARHDARKIVRHLLTGSTALAT